MINTNKVLQLMNNPFTRWLLKLLIFIRYKQRGVMIEKVSYLPLFGAWEFKINGLRYLSSGPGWVYDSNYLLDRLKNFAGYIYMPSEGDIVIDIGAGIGEETIVFSSLVGLEGKVYSIEAHPQTYKALEYMIKVNSLKNVICSNVALSDVVGLVTIEDNENSLANTILPTPKGKSFQIRAETFDAFVTRYGIKEIDLVKMNIEGAEQLIIKEMKASLHLIKYFAISCHDFRFENGESEFFKTRDIVIQFFQDNGFKVTTRWKSPGVLDDEIYATNPALSTTC